MRRSIEAFEWVWAVLFGMIFLYLCFTAIDPTSMPYGQVAWRPGTTLSDSSNRLAAEWDVIRWRVHMMTRGLLDRDADMTMIRRVRREHRL